MLVLTRKIGEEIVVGKGIRIVPLRISGSRVIVGVQAPSDVMVRRGELNRRDTGRAESPGFCDHGSGQVDSVADGDARAGE